MAMSSAGPSGYLRGMSQMPANVIILHCDEMRGDCAGFSGNREVRTPHLDAFARESFILDQHFTVHGKCVPSWTRNWGDGIGP